MEDYSKLTDEIVTTTYEELIHNGLPFLQIFPQMFQEANIAETFKIKKKSTEQKPNKVPPLGSSLKSNFKTRFIILYNCSIVSCSFPFLTFHYYILYHGLISKFGRILPQISDRQLFR